MAKKVKKPSSWDSLDRHVAGVVEQPDFIYGTQEVEKFEDAVLTSPGNRTDLQNSLISNMMNSRKTAVATEKMHEYIREAEKVKKYETLDEGEKLLLGEMQMEEDEASLNADFINPNRPTETKSEEYFNTVTKLKELELKEGTKYKEIKDAQEFRAENGFRGFFAENYVGFKHWVNEAWQKMFRTEDDFVLAGMTSQESKDYKKLYNRKIELERSNLENKLRVLDEDISKIDSIEKNYKAESQKRFENQLSVAEELPSYLKGYAGQASVGAGTAKMFDDYVSIETLRRTLESSKKKITDYLDKNDGLFAGMANHSVFDVIGKSAIEELTIAGVKAKMERGEELTEYDMALAEANAKKQYVDNLDLAKNRFLYRTGDGVGYSLVQMGQTVVTLPVASGVGSVATKYIASPLMTRLASASLSKAISIGEKRVAGKVLDVASTSGLYMLEQAPKVAGVIGQATVMPQTYRNTAERYIGQTQIVTAEDGSKQVLMTNSARKDFVKRADNAKIILEEQLQRLNRNPEANKDAIDRVNKQLYLLEREVASVYDPKTGNIQEDISVEDALIYGYTENLKEVASERFVGSLVDKAGVAYQGSKMANAVNRFGAKTGLSKAAKPLKYLSKQWKKAGDELTSIDAFKRVGKISELNMMHTNGAKMFHSLPGEVLEEIAVELTPTFQEDYMEQLEGLTDPMFYVDVIAQTFVMGGMMTSANVGRHGIKLASDKAYRERSKTLLENRKAIRQLYAEIDNEITDEALAKRISMSSAGTLFEYNEYQAEIARLRKDGQEAEAKVLEENSLYNLAFRALETGTVDEFKQSLREASSSPNLHPDTVLNLANAVGIVEKVENIHGKYNGRVNFPEIAKLYINELAYDKSISQMDDQMSNLKEGVTKFLENHSKNNPLPEGHYISDFFDNFSEKMEDEAFNNYVAEIVEKYKGTGTEYMTSDFVKMTNLAFGKELYEREAYANKEAYYDAINPKNQSKYVEQQLEQVRERIIEEATEENMIESKNLLIQMGLDDTVANSKIDEVVNRKKQTAPAPTISEMTPGTEQGVNSNSPSKSYAELRQEVSKIGKPMKEYISKMYNKPWNKVTHAELSKGVEEYNKNNTQLEIFDEKQIESLNNSINQVKGKNENLSEEQVNSVTESEITSNMSNVGDMLSALTGNKPSLVSEEQLGQQSELQGETTEGEQKEQEKVSENNKVKSVQDGVIESQSLDLYAPREIDNSNEDSSLIKDLKDKFSQINKKHPSVNFDGIVANMRSTFGSSNIESVFNHIAEAWSQATNKLIGDTEKQRVYEANFGPLDLASMFDSNPFTNAVENEVSTPITPEQVISNNELTQVAPVEVTDNLTNDPIVIFPGRKIAESSLKGAFLGNDYAENEQGVYSDVNNVINRTAHIALDKASFPVGETKELTFNFEYLLEPENKMRIWSDVDTNNPQGTYVTVVEMVESIFGKGSYNDVSELLKTKEGQTQLLNNEEFLKIVPTSFILEGKKIGIGINDYQWWNARNVALPTDALGNPLPSVRANIINEARALNLATRRKMFKDGSVNVEVRENRTTARNEFIPSEDKPRNSLLNAFSNNSEYMDKNTTLAVLVNGNMFNNTVNKQKMLVHNGNVLSMDQISNLSEIANKYKSKTNVDTGVTGGSGFAFMLFKEGTLEDGRDRYVATQVIQNPDSMQQQFQTRTEIIKTLKDYAVLIYNAEKGNAQIGEFDHNKYAEALRVKQAIKDQFGIDINDLSSFNDKFTKLYNNGQKQDYYVSNRPFSSDKFETMDITGFSSPGAFLEALFNFQVDTISYEDILRNSLETTLVFTDISANQDGSNMSSVKQSVISFNNNHLSAEEIAEATIGYVDRRSKKEALVEENDNLSKQIDFTKNLINNSEISESEKKVLEEKVTLLEQKQKQTESAIERTENSQAVQNQSNGLEYVTEQKVDFDFNDRQDVVNYVLFNALSKVDVTKPFSKETIYKLIDESFDKMIINLNRQGMRGHSNILTEKRNSILGINEYDGSVRETLDAIFDLQESEDFNFDSEYVKDYNKESFEMDIATSLNMRVKLLLSGITDTRVKTKGFAGFPKFLNFNDTVNALQQVMSNSKNNTVEELENAINEKIKLNPVEFGFYKEILDRIKSVGTDSSFVNNEIMYKLFQPDVSMKFVMFKQNRNGSFVAQVYDANSKNPDILKKRTWKENFKNSPLIEKYNNGFYRINQSMSEKATDLYNQIMVDRANPDLNVVAEYLSLFGIKLNDNTLISMKNGVFNNDSMSFGSEGILGDKKLVQNLQASLLKGLKLQETKELAFEQSSVSDSKHMNWNLLSSDTNNSIKPLIKADNIVSFNPATSMYIGGKMVNAFQLPKRITNILSKLKNDPQYMETLRNTHVTSTTMIVDLMSSFDNATTDVEKIVFKKFVSELKDHLGVDNVSLEALKKAGTSSRDDMEITKLSDKDAFVTVFNMFANNKGTLTLNKEGSALPGYEGVAIRKGIMPFPTLSDSSQMPLFRTALLDIQKTNFENLETGKLSNQVLDIMVDKLVTGELRRVASFLNAGVSTNVAGQDVGSRFITSVSSFNTKIVTFETLGDKGLVEETTTLIDAFSNYNDENGVPFRNDVAGFLNKFSTEIREEMQKVIDHEVNQYYNGTEGFMVENEIVGSNGISNIDSKYLDSKGSLTNSEKAKLITYDYVINSMISLRDIQTIFAGDIANYFKDKMGKNLKLGLPTVDISDIAKHYYPESQVEIMTLVDNYFDPQIDNQGKTEIYAYLQANYPNVLAGDRFSDTTLKNKLEIIAPIASNKLVAMFADVHNNLSKRLKALISPGNQLENSRGDVKYFQIMLQDVDTASEVLDYLIDRFYPNKNTDALKADVIKFKEIDDIHVENRTDEQKDLHEKYLKRFKKEFPLINGFFETASTDAQEYNTWQDNLNQLRSQGRISNENFNMIFDKLTQQSKDIAELGNIRPENRLTEEEAKLAIMQPTKPLYSGLHYEEVNGHTISRDIYIKSSSFPLLPEMTVMFPKLDALRQNLESFQVVDDHSKEVIETIRASYQSANKVGATKQGLPMSELYKNNAELNLDLIANNSVELDRENFFIQGDKPFKSDKNAEAGTQDMNNLATQFEKILLGDDINKMGAVFNNNFSDDILSQAGVTPKNGMITGPDLTKIYNKVYENKQTLFKENLKRRFNISDISEMGNQAPEVMEKLASELNKRLPNKQDREALSLLYVVEENGSEKIVDKDYLVANKLVAKSAQFSLPIWMMPNSRKFESVMNSIINKNSINLKLPGFSAPVASQQGFDFKGLGSDITIKNLYDKGLITTQNFDPKVGLKATRNEEGKLQYAQVFVANKFKLYNEETGKYDYIDLKKYVNPETNQLDTSSFSPELLAMFSFRIPTSSHQSGVIIEVAGFLPHSVGDLMIVPKDHTTQIGEDYDIDTRYMYQYNYIEDADGNIRKLKKEDLPTEAKEVEKVRLEFEEFKAQLLEDYFGGDINQYTVQNNQKLIDIAMLEELYDNYENDQVLRQIMRNAYAVEDQNLGKEQIADLISELTNSLKMKNDKQLSSEFRIYMNQLKNAYRNDTNNAKKMFAKYAKSIKGSNDLLKVEQNNLIDLYMSVFSSNDTQVQSLINKVLSTDSAERTANEMDAVVNPVNSNGIYNFHSPLLQRQILKLGADGKIGIGEHSNAVTMNSIFQQSDYEHKMVKGFDEKMQPYYYNIHLGSLTFDGIMGKIEVNGVRISELGMESQNSATDNQKLQIMGKRNENPVTMSVLKVLQANGIDRDKISVKTLNYPNGVELSYSSLFINQPILREYAKRVMLAQSSTSNQFMSDANAEIYSNMVESLVAKINDEKLAYINKEGYLQFGKNVATRVGKSISSSELYNMLADENVNTNPLKQLYILSTFNELKSAANDYQKLQSFMNIEKDGLGISFFDTLDKYNTLLNFPSLMENISNADKLIGDYVNVNPIDTMYVDADGTLHDGIIPEGELVESTPEQVEKYLKEKYYDNGYIKVGSFRGELVLVKPSNHLAHKIVNSIVSGYEMYNSFFPYDSQIMTNLMNDIFDNTKVKIDTKKGLELKYKIMSELKDYSYSNTKKLLGNVSDTRQKLFFDKNGNQSLASYLLELKMNYSFSDMFKLPFFRELEFDINDGTHPSLIKFNTSDMSKLNSLSIHNSIQSLIGSDEQLLNFNGREYTKGDLAIDLLKYAMIADQGNGAIGFRQYIPMSLFDNAGVSEQLRNTMNPNNDIISNLVINGPFVALKRILKNGSVGDRIMNNNEDDSKVISAVNLINKIYKRDLGVTNDVITLEYSEDGNKVTAVTVDNITDIEKRSEFVKQFFQHNPTSTTKLKLPKGTVASEMIILNNSIEHEDYAHIEEKSGKVRLYEKQHNLNDEIVVYKQIPLLGTFGLKEYEVNKKDDSSLITENNVSQNQTPMDVIGFRQGVNEQDLLRIVQELRNGFDSQYSDLSKLIDGYVDLSSLTIEFRKLDKGDAMYKDGVITLSDHFKDESNYDRAKHVIMEELIHSASVQALSEYVHDIKIDEEGKVIANFKIDESEVIQEVHELLNTYQTALDTMYEEYGKESVMEKMNSMKTGNLQYTKGDNTFTDIYRVSNIHEFIAGILLNNPDETFGKKMNNTFHKRISNVLRKLSNDVLNLIAKILGKGNLDTVSNNVKYDFFSLLEQNRMRNQKPFFNKAKDYKYATPEQKAELSGMIQAASALYQSQISDFTPIENTSQKVDQKEIVNDTGSFLPGNNGLSQLVDFDAVMKSGYVKLLEDMTTNDTVDDKRQVIGTQDKPFYISYSKGSNKFEINIFKGASMQDFIDVFKGDNKFAEVETNRIVYEQLLKMGYTEQMFKELFEQVKPVKFLIMYEAQSAKVGGYDLSSPLNDNARVRAKLISAIQLINNLGSNISSINTSEVSKITNFEQIKIC